MDELFSPSDLQEMRALSNASLPATAVIQRDVATRQPGGGATTVWTDVMTRPCRLALDSAAPGEFLQGDQLRALSKWRLILPMDATIAKDMRVIVTGLNADGTTTWTRTLNVVDVLGPKSYEMNRAVICSDLTMSGR